MKIGILKELADEKRVIVLPEIVKQLISLKVSVIVEKGAGINAMASDTDYETFGATVASDKEVISQCDILLKINPPAREILNQLKEKQILIAVLNPFVNTELVNQLSALQITSFSMELVPRTTKAQSMDILSSMATVAGYKAVLDAALHLPRFFPMFMTAAGTIKPAKVLILGAGVAGLQAIAVARKLGAIVEVFDVRAAVKEEVKSLGAKFIEVEGASEDKAAGGYAIEQTEDFKKHQAELIHNHALSSDVIICTAQIPGRVAPVLIRENTIAQMKPGSVIVDLAASSGGNCEGTQNNKTIQIGQVTIIGNSEYPSLMAVDASAMLGKNVLNFIKLIIDDKGNLNLNFEDEIVKGTCLTHGGEIVSERVKKSI